MADASPQQLTKTRVSGSITHTHAAHTHMRTHTQKYWPMRRAVACGSWVCQRVGCSWQTSPSSPLVAGCPRGETDVCLCPETIERDSEREKLSNIFILFPWVLTSWQCWHVWGRGFHPHLTHLTLTKPLQAYDPSTSPQGNFCHTAFLSRFISSVRFSYGP